MKFDRKVDWTSYSWIKRGPRRIKVLHYLSNANEPITATQLKKIQKIDITQAAYTLNELCKEGFLTCLNPKDHHGKLFVISKKGIKIMDTIKS